MLGKGISYDAEVVTDSAIVRPMTYGVRYRIFLRDGPNIEGDFEAISQGFVTLRDASYWNEAADSIERSRYIAVPIAAISFVVPLPSRRE